MKKLIFIFLLLSFPTLCYSTTYYVRTDGNDTRCTGLVDAADTGSGSNQPCAWLTIQKAASTIAAGDTALVGDGTYASSLNISSSGSAGNIKTYQSKNKWGAIINTLVSITANYITFDGFQFTGSAFQSVDTYAITTTGTNTTITNNWIHDIKNYAIGLLVSGSGAWSLGVANSVISNNLIEDFGCGIFSWGNNVLIDNNEMYHGIYYSGNTDMDYIRFSGDTVTISRNKMWGYIAEDQGISHSDGIQHFQNTNGTSGASNVLIENNFCHIMGGFRFTDEYGGSATNFVIRNNVMIGGWSNEIFYFQCQKNVEIYNNTLYSPNGVGPLAGSSCSGSGPYTIKNNLIYGTVDITPQSGSFLGGTVTADYNLCYNTNGTCTKSNTNDIVNQNPLFIHLPSINTVTGTALTFDWADYRFDLQTGSPAKDHGVNLSSTGFSTDKDGVTRPQGSAWDIGAYEYDTGVPAQVQGLTITGGSIQ